MDLTENKIKTRFKRVKAKYQHTAKTARQVTNTNCAFNLQALQESGCLKGNASPLSIAATNILGAST